MLEDRVQYHTGPTDSAEPPLTIENLVAHAHRQGIPYGGDHLLRKLPGLLRVPCDYAPTDLAHGIGSIIDAVERAPPVGVGLTRHH